MTSINVKFDTPEVIPNTGFAGEEIRFPYSFIGAQYTGTPRQTAKTENGRIIVDISGTIMAIWKLSQSDLIKVLFQIAKEHLEKSLRNSEQREQDIKVEVNSYTYNDACPYDPQFIEEPDGATIQIEVKRPIGFL